MLNTESLDTYARKIRRKRKMSNNIIENKAKIQGKKLKILETKILSTTALILILTFASLMASMPTAKADTPTYAFITVSPNPVGVNQVASIIMWLDKINPTTNGVQGDRWQGFTVLVTKPDGTTQTLGPFKADPAAFAYTQYSPDQTGNYTLKFSFPGQQVTGIGAVVPIPINEHYQGSSFTTTLKVQQQQVATTPQTPLPSDYWTRPIDAQNQEWYQISGNWLGTGTGSFGTETYNGTGNFNPYTKAPNSAHIVWKQPSDFGGLIGGEFGGTTTSNYYTGKSYEPKFTPPIIINGVLYYNVPSPPREGFYAVDLRTGETLWWQNSTGQPFNVGANPIVPTYGFAGITMGQVYNYMSPNQIGGIPYLWYMPSFQISSVISGGTPFYMYDAVRGNLILTLLNATTGGTTVEGPNGELLTYILDGTRSQLAMWNSSLCIGTASAVSTGAWLWRPPVGATIDWRRGVQWNVTTPVYPGQAIYQINSGIILATTGGQFLPQNWQMEIGYDATTGQQKWVQNRTTPQGSTAYGLMGPFINGVYTEYHKETMQWYGYSASTGLQIWGPSAADTNAWGSQPGTSLSAYGTLYGVASDGIHAFNLATGQKLWDFYGDPSGYDFPGFSTYPFESSVRVTIADGKIFAGTGNSHSDPLFRGARLYAIDAQTGKQVWAISGFYRDTMPAADGYLVAFNGYDNSLYCFGKGQTSITVSAPQNVQPLGNSVLIQGTVMDQSPGLAKGTPAVSDDSMSAWMEHLFMQQSKPTNATGVPVTLTAVDPNGNSQDIGTVTSDISGAYSIMWTPPVPGKYVVTASFDGSESYWPSSAETAFGVMKAPAAQPAVSPLPSSTASPQPVSSPSPAISPTPPTPPSNPAAPMTLYIVVAAAIIIIVVVAAAVVLRRRK